MNYAIVSTLKGEGEGDDTSGPTSSKKRPKSVEEAKAEDASEVVIVKSGKRSVDEDGNSWVELVSIAPGKRKRLTTFEDAAKNKLPWQIAQLL